MERGRGKGEKRKREGARGGRRGESERCFSGKVLKQDDYLHLVKVPFLLDEKPV